MKFDNTSVYNFENALRGMRNPKNSWNRSDSEFGFYTPVSDEEKENCYSKDMVIVNQKGNIFEYMKIGENDLKRARSLIKAGSEHRKFMRQIFVSVDITAPLFWWKEFSTYKIGTTANSTSTMHKLADTPITMDCFEMDDHTNDMSGDILYHANMNFIWKTLIDNLERLRQKYNETKNKIYWKELVRLLPESWLQTRTITMNYEVIFNMVHQRENHKLNEWSGKDNPDLPNFISWAKSLPYADELLFLE